MYISEFLGDGSRARVSPFSDGAWELVLADAGDSMAFIGRETEDGGNLIEPSRVVSMG